MIRHARTGDQDSIAAVVASAFGRDDEARLVAGLRTDGDSLVEFVAEIDGRVVGHIQFSRLWADSIQLYAALAPVSVLPEHQGQGHGQALCKAGISYCRDFGAHGVIVLGDPGYYQRFGFTGEAAVKVKSPFSGSPAFMALALEPGALDQPLIIAYPAAFGV